MKTVEECFQKCESKDVCTAYQFSTVEYTEYTNNLCELYKGGPYTYGDTTISKAKTECFIYMSRYVAPKSNLANIFYL